MQTGKRKAASVQEVIDAFSAEAGAPGVRRSKKAQKPTRKTKLKQEALDRTFEMLDKEGRGVVQRHVVSQVMILPKPPLCLLHL